MSFGSKLKELRKNKKMTQKELGEYIGKSIRSVQEYEKDSVMPGPDVLKKICNLYGVTMSDLIDDDTNIYITPPTVMIEQIINDLYTFEVDSESKRVFIYNNKDIDLILSINEFNLLKDDIISCIKNRVEFLNSFKRCGVDG